MQLDRRGFFGVIGAVGAASAPLKQRATAGVQSARPPAVELDVRVGSEWVPLRGLLEFGLLEFSSPVARVQSSEVNDPNFDLSRHLLQFTAAVNDQDPAQRAIVAAHGQWRGARFRVGVKGHDKQVFVGLVDFLLREAPTKWRPPTLRFSIRPT